MKRIFIIFPLLIIITFCWYGESRKFYCLNNGNCLTVWKTYNDVCYIIPGKYYGILRPSKNFIKSTNSNNLTIFFTDELPNALIFKTEQNLTVYRSNSDKVVFYNYNMDNRKFDKILYKPNAKKASDIKENARLVDIFIQENFAIDKDGKQL